MMPPLPKPHPDVERATDRFFEHHLAGVRARLEAQTRKAMERQHVAWRDSLQREALLEEKDFLPNDPS